MTYCVLYNSICMNILNRQIYRVRKWISGCQRPWDEKTEIDYLIAVEFPFGVMEAFWIVT